MHAAKTAAWRKTTDDGFTGDTVNLCVGYPGRRRHTSFKSLLVRNRYAMLTRNADERSGISLDGASYPGWTAEGPMMTRHSAALKLLAGGLGAFAVTATSAVAFAQPDTSPPVPSLIDQLVTSSPALSVNPTDDGSQSSQWGGFGMICQNFGIRCR